MAFEKHCYEVHDGELTLVEGCRYNYCPYCGEEVHP